MVFHHCNVNINHCISAVRKKGLELIGLYTWMFNYPIHCADFETKLLQSLTENREREKDEGLAFITE